MSSSMTSKPVEWSLGPASCKPAGGHLHVFLLSMLWRERQLFGCLSLNRVFLTLPRSPSRKERHKEIVNIETTSCSMHTAHSHQFGPSICTDSNDNGIDDHDQRKKYFEALAPSTAFSNVLIAGLYCHIEFDVLVQPEASMA